MSAGSKKHAINTIKNGQQRYAVHVRAIPITSFVCNARLYNLTHPSERQNKIKEMKSDSEYRVGQSRFIFVLRQNKVYSHIVIY